MDTSEKRFESDIESFLVSEAGGYEQFSYLNPDGHRIQKYVYDKEKAIYPEVLVNFIARSNPRHGRGIKNIMGTTPLKNFTAAFKPPFRKTGFFTSSNTASRIWASNSKSAFSSLNPTSMRSRTSFTSKISSAVRGSSPIPNSTITPWIWCSPSTAFRGRARTQKSIHGTGRRLRHRTVQKRPRSKRILFPTQSTLFGLFCRRSLQCLYDDLAFRRRYALYAL